LFVAEHITYLQCHGEGHLGTHTSVQTDTCVWVVDPYVAQNTTSWPSSSPHCTSLQSSQRDGTVQPPPVSL